MMTSHEMKRLGCYLGEVRYTGSVERIESVGYEAQIRDTHVPQRHISVLRGYGRRQWELEIVV